ncbi:WXG100 family type VII secretion target [Streptomyces sp. YGL11-2]|uniref:WXG100 family type VII secretion target n=1 Tax=Streptomyces sp. YGL11-2 TaxID=3414028 RepID=UPI003CECD86F
MSAGSGQQVADNYEWAKHWLEEPLIPLPEIHNPVSEGLDAGLDDIVKSALDATGLMDCLEQVTGKLDELTAAAKEWQAQSKALKNVAKELRSGAATLSQEWTGQASNAFGAHMGRTVAAIDATAADMEQTAQLISQAAAECKVAEEMVIEIIREAIEALILSLAAMVIVDIATLGLATIADALVADAEITVFIARVARVSEQLATKLEELVKAVREIKSAGKSFKNIKDGLKAANDVRKVGGIMNKGKSLGNLVRSPSMANLGEFGASQGVAAYNGIFKSGAALILGDGDPVKAAKKGVGSDTNANAMAEEADGRPPEHPYHVPKSTVQETFG